MPLFTANATRIDPYKNFKFQVSIGGTVVLGVSQVGGLTRTTEVVTHREGADPHSPRKSPGQTDYGPITLQRGITWDLTFLQRANSVWYYPNSDALGENISLGDFRFDMVVTLMNEAGQPAMAYNVYRCWISEFNALPELDGMGQAVAIESMTVQNEGWDRDMGVAEPTEPAYGLLPA